MAKPFRVSFIGIDGSGKSTVSDSIVNDLSDSELVLRTGPSLPVYLTHKGQRRDFTGFLARSASAISMFSRRVGLKSLVSISSAISASTIARRIEPAVINNYKPDIVIECRNFKVDAKVYSQKYLPLFSLLPDKQKIRVLEYLVGSNNPDTLFYIKVDPEIAIERINRDVGLVGTKKIRKFKDVHENVNDLSRLQCGYDLAISQLFPCGGGTKVYQIDSGTKSISEMVDEIRTVVRDDLTLYNQNLCSRKSPRPITSA